jgi:hypothetical protein
VGNLPPQQSLFDLQQVRFVARRESDGVGAGREVTGTTLAGRVDQLGRENAER